MKAKPKLIHCSFDEVYDFEPRVPKSRNDLEDGETKRICVAPTVRQCLDAIPKAGNIMRFMREVGMPVVIHAYYLESDNVVYDTTGKVPDAELTGEMWVLDKPYDWRRVDYELTGFSLKDGKDANGDDITWIFGVWPIRTKYTDNLKELVEGMGKTMEEFREKCPDLSFRMIAGNASPELTQEFKEMRSKYQKEKAFKNLQKRVENYRKSH